MRMRAIKGFRVDEHGRLYCKPDRYKFYFEIGKVYKMNRKKVKMCERGFHASRSINHVMIYYPPNSDVVYGEVDIEVVDEMPTKIVGNRIKVLKILSFEETLQLDLTGEFSYKCAPYHNDENEIKMIEKSVIEKDKTGQLIFYLAHYLSKKGIDIHDLEKAVIKKDPTGEWCYRFVKQVKGANVKRFEHIIIDKDKTGRWCSYLLMDVEGINRNKVYNALLAKDKEKIWIKGLEKEREV